MFIFQLIVIQGLTFLALVFFLKKVLYSNFMKAMKRLEISNQETEKKRRELERTLLEMKSKFEAQAKENEARAAQIQKQAEEEAEETRTRLLAEAQQEAAKTVEAAQAKEKEWRQELEREFSEKAVQVAGGAVRYLLNSRLDQAIHRQLISDLIQEIERLDAKRLNGQSHTAQVAVPFALSELERSKLEEALEKKMKRKIEVTPQVDRALMAGMVLRFESVILDGSLKAKLKEAVSYVRKGEKHEE